MNPTANPPMQLNMRQNQRPMMPPPGSTPPAPPPTVPPAAGATNAGGAPPPSPVNAAPPPMPARGTAMAGPPMQGAAPTGNPSMISQLQGGAMPTPTNAQMPSQPIIQPGNQPPQQNQGRPQYSGIGAPPVARRQMMAPPGSSSGPSRNPQQNGGTF